MSEKLSAFSGVCHSHLYICVCVSVFFPLVLFDFPRSHTCKLCMQERVESGDWTVSHKSLSSFHYRALNIGQFRGNEKQRVMKVWLKSIHESCHVLIGSYGLGVLLLSLHLISFSLSSLAKILESTWKAGRDSDLSSVLFPIYPLIFSLCCLPVSKIMKLH